MENYIWIVIVIFVIAVVSYLKSTKQKENAEETSDEKTMIGIGGVYDGQKIRVSGEVIIGRDPEKCSVVYPNNAKGVSAVHCSVAVKNEKVELVDLASSFGTFKNEGERLTPNRIYGLEVGDSFYVGNKENTFIIK